MILESEVMTPREIKPRIYFVLFNANCARLLLFVGICTWNNSHRWLRVYDSYVLLQGNKMLCVTVTIKAELGKIRIFEETNDDLSSSRQRRWTTKNVSRFATYIVSNIFLFRQASSKARNEPRFHASPSLSYRHFPRKYFSKISVPTIFPHRHDCLERLCSRSPHAFQQLHFSVGSCSPRIQSYRRFEP